MTAPSGTAWIIPSNPRMFDADAAFRHKSELDWSETSVGIGLGDTVYLYTGRPVKALTHKCLVVRTAIPPRGSDR